MPISLEFQRSPYRPDLEGVRGGLDPSRQEDLQLIQIIKQEIAAGLRDADELSSRHPKAAADFNSAKANAERAKKLQDITLSNFTPAQPASSAQGPLQPGESRGSIAPQGFPAQFDRGQAIQQALQAGVLGEGANKLFGIAESALPTQPKPLTTSNVINTINPKTGKSEIVTVDQAIRERRSKAPSKTINIEEKPITPNESLKLVDASGNHPVGMSLGEAYKKGFRPMGTEAQKQLQAGQGARKLIGKLTELAFNTNVFSKPGFGARVKKTIENAFTQASQGNVDLQTFVDIRRSTLSLLVRALGEKGTLTQQDVARIDNALPRASGYSILRGQLVDTRPVAIQKFKELGGIMNEIRNSVMQRGQGPMPKDKLDALIESLESGDQQALTAPALPEGWSVRRK